MHLFSDSASHYSSTPLLQKNSACAAADVAISGEIHFGRGSVPINERPDAFDYVEADLRDVLRAQPFEDCAALERDWQCLQFFHRQIRTNSWHRCDIRVSQRRQLAFDPIFFFG